MLSKQIDKKRKVWVVGSVPEPIGGVSVFIWRFINYYDRYIGGLVDPYHSSKKFRIGCAHRLAFRYKLLRYPWLLARLNLLCNRAVFLNFSTARALLIYALVYRSQGMNSYLLLHHGSLSASWTTSKPAKRFLGKLLQRFTKIGYMGAEQKAFYDLLEVPPSALVKVSTYLPPVKGEALISEPGESLRSVLKWIDSSDTPLCIASGYANETYNHDWILNELPTAEFRGRIRYLLCCYGPRTSHLSELQLRFDQEDQAMLVYGLSPNDFSEVLKLARLYVRPTDVDSFGVAIAEALSFGVPVVASDVCERAPGAILFRSGNKLEFLEKVSEIALNSEEVSVNSASEGQPSKDFEMLIEELRG